MPTLRDHLNNLEPKPKGTIDIRKTESESGNRLHDQRKIRVKTKPTQTIEMEFYLPEDPEYPKV